MSHCAKLLLLVALLALGWGANSDAAKRTVCTITVNSPDEKEMFRQRLPEDQYQFVELVERGRPNWLASACRQGIRCDLLVISGHFDGSTEFYSDQLAANEFLPVAEMERASCLTFRTSRDAFLRNFHGAWRGQGLRGASASMMRSVATSQARISFFTRR